MADNKKIQSLTGIGGMDYDSDEKYIQDGDYKYIVNGIKIGVGEDGVTVNMPGNENAEDVASTFLVDNSGSYLVDDLDTITSTEQDGNIPPSKIVGHCKDPKRNGILLFLKGVSGEGSGSVSDDISTYSSIYEFFAAGQIYVPILKNSQLIDVDSDVVDMTVIGDRLYWLERGGEPRTLNIVKAYNYTHNKNIKEETVTAAGWSELGIELSEDIVPDPFLESEIDRVYATILSGTYEGNTYQVDSLYDYLGSDYLILNTSNSAQDTMATEGASIKLYQVYEDAYIDINENVISLIKKPPLYQITTSYGYDSNFNGSNISRRIFQFKEQYIYEDSLKSSFGNISDINFNSSTISYDGDILSTTDVDNYIYILFNSGDSSVKKIRIAAREGNESDWYEIDIVDKTSPSNVFDGDGNRMNYLFDDTDYYYRFYNTGGYRPVADNEISKPYENIPIVSNNMCAYGNNRLIFGQNKIDYQDVSIDMSMSPNYQSRSSEPYKLDHSNETPVDHYTGSEISITIGYDIDSLPDPIPAGMIINMKFYMYGIYNTNDGDKTFYVPDPGGLGTNSSDQVVDNFVIIDSEVSKTDFVNNILSYISFDEDKAYVLEDNSSISVVSTTVTRDSGVGYDRILVENVYDIGSNVNSLSTGYTSLVRNGYAWTLSESVKPSLKRGRTRQGAIQYIDKFGRRGEPLTDNNCEFRVKEFADSASKGQVKLDVSINHNPPDWADYYQILMSHQKHKFVQVPILYSEQYLDGSGSPTGYISLLLGLTADALRDAVENDIDELEQELSQAEDYKRWYSNRATFEKSFLERTKGDPNEEIKEIERQIELKKYELTNLYKRALQNVRQYQFSKNDRIRLIKAGNTSAEGGAYYDSTNYVSNVLDFAVEDVLDSVEFVNGYLAGDELEVYGGLWLKVKPPNVNGWTEETLLSKWDNALIEVYRPNYSDSENMYYETSYIYPITDGSHSQTSLTIVPNDCWFKIRSFNTGDQINNYGPKVADWVEDYQITHDFKSDSYDIGNVFIKTTKEKGLKLSNLVYTNNHIEGTEINGLSQADFDNIVYLSEEYGDIYGVWKSGNTLKVAQAKKITSFYPSGDSFLGKMRYSQTDYGTVYPKAMADSPYGYRYGFDVYNGVVWRDTNNGVYNLAGKSVVRGGVSDYKMGKYFRDVAKEIRDNGINKGGDDVIAAYDEEYELVYFSFLQTNLDSDVVPYRTIMFHEPSNRWVGFLDIQPTGYAYGYNALLSSNEQDGNIYLHGRKEDISGTANYNVFYETQKNFEAEFVANIMPGIRKVFDAMAIHATTQFSVPEMTIAKDGTTINEKFSKLNTNHFVLQDGVYKSEILGNMKTTSDTASSRELYNGDRMRGYAMKFKLRSSDSDKFELFKVDVYVDPYAT